MRAQRLIGVTLGLGAVLAGAACSSDGDTAPAAQPQAAAASPSPTPPPEHPFTGRPIAQRRPVLAVKIENTSAGKPQMGVRSADIVYVEQVEGGLTRLMAIFSSKLPAQVGPVRSARISDLHILPQFGKPALSYSGVQTKMIPYVQKASLFDVSDSSAPGAYFRAPGRYAPYNLFGTPRKLLAKASQAAKADDIGFVFSDEPPAGGVPQKTVRVRYPAANFEFAWSETQKRWLVSQDGKKDMAAEGGQQGAPTIVVQWVKTDRSEFHDFTGSYTPMVHTVGKGTGVVLRDGMAYKVKWERPSEEEGTTYTMADGTPMPFARGQVWVVLASRKPVAP
ncbi:DUF3048 domain-containing protein [Microtetraspora sp. AC03309]|uniref:DUF3048 domain-containing protein n=1 Tax=Microtetraspora sp. AC03309 TaxID=2779376 RepID=UPI001E2A8871|nr:DUF3048 domain-containing protein [Microtetraspora sp. AC03309]MCC5579357.1 DUF3048 domain-containing protein [Microtetraspora sp. AC03309]